ncbi:hypothetical protein PFC_04910 [Pyrococcus furiosus COM1]|uniref:Uncharacterized protein n=1 Tax=Pyrococcus furiosus COM1 TaxID=1185654 RepID=I6TWZ7_9EURY|nr:hypothetical protein PFC_04910 [Pyrococcus furiosus COM1]
MGKLQFFCSLIGTGYEDALRIMKEVLFNSFVVLLEPEAHRVQWKVEAHLQFFCSLIGTFGRMVP